jgi:hypothetical protein
MAGMTEADLDLLRLKFKVEVQHVLIKALYISLARTAPNGRKMLEDQFAMLRQVHSQVAPKGLDPAYSDLVAAEYQEALDDTLLDIETALKAVP